MEKIKAFLKKFLDERYSLSTIGFFMLADGILFAIHSDFHEAAMSFAVAAWIFVCVSKVCMVNTSDEIISFLQKIVRGQDEAIKTQKEIIKRYEERAKISDTIEQNQNDIIKDLTHKLEQYGE